MQLTLYAGSNCILKSKIEAAAHIVGDSITRKESSDFPREVVTVCRFPALGTPSGYIPGSNASLRYIANSHPVYELYGRSCGERAAVDAALDMITTELETPLLAFEHHGADIKLVSADLKKTFGACDATLAKQTYLVCERLSIADLSLAGAVAASVQLKVLTTEDLGQYVNLCRLYNTIAGRCEWKLKHIEPNVEAVAASPSAGGKKAGKKDEGKKKEEKKEEKKEDKPAAEAAPPAPKVKDPIELLPPTDFDMEAWKRYYSNSKDLKGDAMPYLWEHLDKEGWSFWHMEYQRYTEDDNTKEFMASNLLGMFLQRIDNWLRKYMFAVCNVFQEDGYYGVEGIFLWRGQEVPQRLVENDQYESFKWTKLSLDTDKQKITDFFCEGDEINGKAIKSCKVYK